MSRLDLVVGPNGAGKSTFVEFVLAQVRPGTPFVNADVIAAERWPEDPLSHAYDASQAAEAARGQLIASGESFIAETVASHESKVDLVRTARDAGYFVHLIVVAVPEEKVRARWRRLWAHVVTMVELADSAEVFDNTGPGPVTIATFVAGEIVGAPRWPNWTPTELMTRWP